MSFVPSYYFIHIGIHIGIYKGIYIGNHIDNHIDIQIVIHTVIHISIYVSICINVYKFNRMLILIKNFHTIRFNLRPHASFVFPVHTHPNH